jgi:hypothetical protein
MLGECFFAEVFKLQKKPKFLVYFFANSSGQPGRNQLKYWYLKVFTFYAVQSAAVK